MNGYNFLCFAFLIFSRFLWAFKLSHQEWLYIFSHSSHTPLCNVFCIFSQQKVKATAFYPWIWACPLVTCLLLIRNLQTWCRGFKRTCVFGICFLTPSEILLACELIQVFLLQGETRKELRYLCFPQWLYQFTFPTTVSFLLHTCEHLLSLVFFITAILTGVQWYHCGFR